MVTLGITVAADSPCGDWEPYKDEKCFKVFDKVGSEEEAEKSCSQQENSATLVTVHSKDEQDFLSNLLFKTHKIVDAVWIGAKYSSNKFKWADDSDLSFTNWAEGCPSNTLHKACVQMVPEGSSIGKWTDEPCNKNNKVVCQRMQNWPISRLQKTFLDARKELQDSLEDVRKQLKESQEDRKQLSSSLEDVRKQLKESQEDRKQLNSSLEDVRKNPVPIGFIYVQLPSQPEPKTLWSMVEWKDVTSDYAGLFFRAEGGNSFPFGQTQSSDSPRLSSVGYKDQKNREGIVFGDIKLPTQGCSPYIISAYETSEGPFD
jgi:hypothetical protein